jgi:regulator of replication initiation timing
MRIDASHEFGTETWEQRARACAAELEEAKGNITALMLQNETLIIQAGELEIKIQGMQEGTLIPQLEAENERLKARQVEILVSIYKRGYHVSASVAVADYCDEVLDKSGALLGLVREAAASMPPPAYLEKWRINK